MEQFAGPKKVITSHAQVMHVKPSRPICSHFQTILLLGFIIIGRICIYVNSLFFFLFLISSPFKSADL